MFSQLTKQQKQFILVALVAVFIYLRFFRQENYTEGFAVEQVQPVEYQYNDYVGCYKTEEKLQDIDDIKNVFPKFLEAPSSGVIGLAKDKDNKLKYFVAKSVSTKASNKVTTCTNQFGSTVSNPVSVGIYRPSVPASKINLVCYEKLADEKKLKVHVNNQPVDPADISFVDKLIVINVKPNPKVQNGWAPGIPTVTKILIEYDNQNPNKNEIALELDKIYAVILDANISGKLYTLLLKQGMHRYYSKKKSNIQIPVTWNHFNVVVEKDLQEQLAKKKQAKEKNDSKRRSKT